MATVDDPRLRVRGEQPGDIEAIRRVNREAFGRELEGRIVDALRANGAALLSLVAVDGGSVVGHIMFSPATAQSLGGAALGPMAVVTTHQRRGIGTRLVKHGLARLRGSGHPFVVVIGHPGFYPRFGFEPAGAHGLTCAWEVPAEAFMVNVLNPEARSRLRGAVEYRSEFSAAGET